MTCFALVQFPGPVSKVVISRFKSWQAWGRRMALLGGALTLVCGAVATPPSIDYVEPFLATQLLIHFDTDANRTYFLEYTETLQNGVPAGAWTNLFTAPSLPFVNHYIVVDTRLRPQRFYRLRVTP